MTQSRIINFMIEWTVVALVIGMFVLVNYAQREARHISWCSDANAEQYQACMQKRAYALQQAFEGPAMPVLEDK